jgi:hypothetical protein
MINRARSVRTIPLLLSGAGLGAIAAEMRGVSSSLDAKIFLAVGAALGAALAALLDKAKRLRK